LLAQGGGKRGDRCGSGPRAKRVRGTYVTRKVGRAVSINNGGRSICLVDLPDVRESNTRRRQFLRSVRSTPWFTSNTPPRPVSAQRPQPLGLGRHRCRYRPGPGPTGIGSVLPRSRIAHPDPPAAGSSRVAVLRTVMSRVVERTVPDPGGRRQGLDVVLAQQSGAERLMYGQERLGPEPRICSLEFEHSGNRWGRNIRLAQPHIGHAVGDAGRRCHARGERIAAVMRNG